MPSNNKQLTDHQVTEQIDTWVYDGVEVTKTGRKAQRIVQSGGRIYELIEITPVDRRMVGEWKKWVKDSELYKVLLT